MGPRSDDRGKQGERSHPHIGRRQASMGPRSDDRGKPRLPQPLRRHRQASMGPRSDDRGKRGERATGMCQIWSLQWGRGRMTAERTEEEEEGNVGQTASMGPRSDDRGKCSPARGAEILGPASMGPRSDDRGKLKNGRSVTSDNWLQWGRGRMTAESTQVCPLGQRFGSLQWGRGRMTAESFTIFL